MFDLSLRDGGGAELRHDRHPAAHSARAPHTDPHPCLPYPGLAHLSLCLSGEEREKKETHSWFGGPGLGPLLHPHCPGPLDGHHFLELWVLVQVTPISSLDLQPLDLKVLPGHMSPSQPLLLKVPQAILHLPALCSLSALAAGHVSRAW